MPAVVIFLSDDLREKWSVPLTKQSDVACFKILAAHRLKFATLDFLMFCAYNQTPFPSQIYFFIGLPINYTFIPRISADDFFAISPSIYISFLLLL